MGFLDGAKSKLDKLKNIGEETFKTVDSEKIPANEEAEARVKPAKEKRKSKRIADLLPKREPREEEQDPDDLPDYSGDGGDDELSDDAMELAFAIATDSPFEIDEDQEFYQGIKNASKEPKREPGDVFDDLPQAGSDSSRRTRKGKKNLEEVDESKIKDVLEILRIPSTYIIPNDVLMPEDFKDVEFDLQVPQGYDIGQVEFFIERAEGTVKEYLKLLEQRNDHIAILATTVDRLQVDLENVKFDAQIAAGIGIMPTSDNQELEQDNIELRLQVKRLEDALKAKSEVPDLTSRERELYENLRNEFSILKRENEEYRQENSDLRMTIAKMEEDAEDTNWRSDDTPSSFALPEDSDDFGGAATREEVQEQFQEELDLSDNEGLPDLGGLPSLPTSTEGNAPLMGIGDSSELLEFEEDDEDDFELPNIGGITNEEHVRPQDGADQGRNPFADDDDDDDMQLPRGW